MDHAIFMIMPLVHQESLIHLVAAAALSEQVIVKASAAGTAQNPSSHPAPEGLVGTDPRFPLSLFNADTKLHKQMMLRFGRFPKRNKVLGRQETAEERDYLREEAEKAARFWKENEGPSQKGQ